MFAIVHQRENQKKKKHEVYLQRGGMQHSPSNSSALPPSQRCVIASPSVLYAGHITLAHLAVSSHTRCGWMGRLAGKAEER